jgi:hypothetical protein
MSLVISDISQEMFEHEKRSYVSSLNKWYDKVNEKLKFR